MKQPPLSIITAPDFVKSGETWGQETNIFDYFGEFESDGWRGILPHGITLLVDISMRYCIWLPCNLLEFAHRSIT
jgi:hypothetical protein